MHSYRQATAWKFPKFHELLHLVDDIERFGAPINYCAQRLVESMLIPVAKKPSRCAQKRQQGVAYELQVAQRLSYLSSLTPCIHVFGKTPKLDRTPNTGRATFATVACFNHPQVPYSKKFAVTWETETDTARIDPPLALSKFMLQQFGNPVGFCSEFRIGKHIFRYHPSFQSDGAMYNWMKADFQGTVYPCLLAAVAVSTDDDVTTTHHLRDWHQFGAIYRVALVKRVSYDRAVKCSVTMFRGFHQERHFESLDNASH
jgi:hypothetical protein